jgi:hypothetical protein
MPHANHKPKSNPDANALNEFVLESAAQDEGEIIAPEVSPVTAEITVWDECPDTAGRHVRESPDDDEMTISEQLVDAGIEEADREKREAAETDEDDR